MANPRRPTLPTPAAAGVVTAASTAATSTSASSSAAPPLPNAAAAPLASPLRRLLTQAVTTASALTNVVASPFRGALPIENVDASPSTSVDVSAITDPSDPSACAESNASILAQVSSLYATTGDGGDSDDEGEEAELHDAAVHSEDRLRSGNRAAADLEDIDSPLDEDDVGEQIFPIPGAPDGWAAPLPPITFKGYSPKNNSDAPSTFDQVDNPGKWTDYMFQPKYKGVSYQGHFTPAGAKVVPQNIHGRRAMNGWQFHYDGWVADDFAKSTYVRGGATAEDMKPKSRGLRLDVGRLKKHGINSDSLDSPIHFYQLLLPICDPSRSGIEGDGRMPFYTLARTYTNTYAFGEKGWGGGYSHEFDRVSEQELVHWMAVPIRHGARGGTPMTLHYRWITDDEEVVAQWSQPLGSDR
jgi:hypothetical protein